MAELEQGCLPARDALAQVSEIGLFVRALERRIDQDATDRRRLGERVTEIASRIEDHESASQVAVRELKETVNLLRQTVQEAIAAPPVPAGTTLVQSWRETPIAAKTKITGSIIGLLLAPEFLKAAGKAALELITRFIAHH